MKRSLKNFYRPHDFTIKCKNCTTQGTIDLFQGSITMDRANGTSNDTENIIQFFSNGYLELRVDDFAAHIELESSIQPSKSLTLYKVPMPEIGLPGFQVCDLRQHFDAVVVANICSRYLALLLLDQSSNQVSKSVFNWPQNLILRMGLM